MLCNQSDHQNYDFVLVLYLFRDISSFKSEKGGTAKVVQASFINKKDKYLYHYTDRDNTKVKRNTKFLEFWFSN